MICVLLGVLNPKPSSPKALIKLLVSVRVFRSLGFSSASPRGRTVEQLDLRGVQLDDSLKDVGGFEV